MFGYISTKDLYLVELAMISGLKYDGTIRTTYFDEERLYAVVKKVGDLYPDYVDVFSKTTYRHWSDAAEKGVVAVRKAIPIMTINKRIKLDDLRRLLIEKNNICYDENKVKKLTK